MSSLAEQKQFFDTFGFLVFPGLLADDIAWITQEFEQVFVDHKVVHDPEKRTCIVPFIDQREQLSGLLDYPTLHAIAENLLGADFNYMGSDGNYYTGDTAWHSDGWHDVNTYLKIAFYLDPVARETGALRVIPGTHLQTNKSWEARKARQAKSLWGVEEKDVPAIALVSQPGDVVVFNHGLMHAAFGGNTRRRMFTINLCGHCETAEEITDLKNYIHSHDRFWIEHMHGPIMVNTASEQRLRHLRQVQEHEGALATLSAQARLRMPESARG